MDKIEETYNTASWVFRELITLKEFRKVIKNLNPSLNNDFKKVCHQCNDTGYYDDGDGRFMCKVCDYHESKPISKS